MSKLGDFLALVKVLVGFTFVIIGVLKIKATIEDRTIKICRLIKTFKRNRQSLLRVVGGNCHKIFIT